MFSDAEHLSPWAIDCYDSNITRTFDRFFYSAAIRRLAQIMNDQNHFMHLFNFGSGLLVMTNTSSTTSFLRQARKFQARMNMITSA